MIENNDFNVLKNLTITKFYSVNNFFSQAYSGNNRTNRTSWAIVFKYDGETKYTNKKQTVFSNNNNLVILPRNSSYSWTCLKSGHFYIIEFDTNIEYDKMISCGFDDPDTILNIIDNLMNEKNSLDGFSNLKNMQLLYKLLYLLLRNNIATDDTQEKRQIIMPAIKYINDNLNEKIDNETLAKLCFISTSYFRRIFTEIFKVPPAHYITDLRIQQAKELLHSDYINITEIAKQIGFDDVYHFSKIFKQKTGYSPLNYLKQKNNNR